MERPNIQPEDVCSLVNSLYGLKVTNQTPLDSYDDINVHVHVENTTNNVNIENIGISTSGYVLKILNSVDSKKTEFVDAMHAAIEAVAGHVTTSRPVRNMAGKHFSLEDIPSATDDQHKCVFLVRLFEFIPGELLKGKPYTPSLCFQVGELAGKLNKAWIGFDHVGLRGHKRHWSLTETANLETKFTCVTDDQHRKLVQEVADAFKQSVVDNYQKLQKGVIHGDLNEGNILVKRIDNDDNSEEVEYSIHGVIDFGDLVNEYKVFEVSIAMMYMMINSEVIDPVDAAGHVLAGYLSHQELPSLDRQVIKECVCARFAQSLVYGAYEHEQDPSNTYCLDTAKRGWPVLKQMWTIGKADLYSRWQEILNSYNIDIQLL